MSLPVLPVDYRRNMHKSLWWCIIIIIEIYCFFNIIFNIALQETHHEMRIPECDMNYIMLSVYLHMLIQIFTEPEGVPLGIKLT